MIRKALFLVVASVLIWALTMTAMAAGTGVTYYDANGNQVYGPTYYGQNNCLYFGEGCYYIDSEGNNVYVGGYRAYCYDQNGNLVYGGNYGSQGTPRYQNGNSYGGCCRGWW